MKKEQQNIITEQNKIRDLQEKTIQKLNNLQKNQNMNISKILEVQNKNINFFRKIISETNYKYRKSYRKIIGYKKKSNIVRKYRYKIKPFNY
ncbi:MAG: hypothetical protein HFJ40_04180 [Clostridia bacterium]|nr:hypothetical protein [Clostridia bacterium]